MSAWHEKAKYRIQALWRLKVRVVPVCKSSLTVLWYCYLLLARTSIRVTGTYLYPVLLLNPGKYRFASTRSFSGQTSWILPRPDMKTCGKVSFQKKSWSSLYTYFVNFVVSWPELTSPRYGTCQVPSAMPHQLLLNPGEHHFNAWDLYRRRDPHSIWSEPSNLYGDRFHGSFPGQT